MPTRLILLLLQRCPPCGLVAPGIRDTFGLFFVDLGRLRCILCVSPTSHLLHLPQISLSQTHHFLASLFSIIFGPRNLLRRFRPSMLPLALGAPQRLILNLIDHDCGSFGAEIITLRIDAVRGETHEEVRRVL